MADFILKVDTAVEVFVNIAPLIDDTDFKTRETAVAYNAAGMDLVWNFQTPAGVVTQTAVTPTTGGSYDWTHVGDGLYKIEIPASGGASINNDTEGFGWFSGVVTGVLPWRGPVIQFSPANVVDSLVLGSDKLEVDATQISGAAVSTSTAQIGVNVIQAAGTAWASGAITAAALAADAITAAKISSDVSAEIADAVWDEAQSGHTTAGTFGRYLDSQTSAIETDTADIQSRLPAALVSGRMDSSVGAMASNTLTAAALATDAVTEIQSGLATAADLATVDTVVDSILVDTAEIGAAGAGLTALASAANLATVAGYIDTEVAAIKAKTDNLPASPAATGDIPSAASIATAVHTTQMTESYAADGTAPTLAQALYLVMQSMTEMAISGTTITVKKLDGSTTAATFTLDSATTPTSRTRAS